MKEIYTEAIEKYIESKQMREYLVNKADILQKWQIIDLICGARADLKEKYDSLKKLSEKETEEEKSERNSATSAASNAKIALEGLAVKPGEVFLNVEYGYDRDIKEEKIYGASPHFSLEPIMKYINEEYSELDDEEKENATYWYRLEKYVPGVIDDLDLPYDYTVAPSGEIWFTDNARFDHIDFASSQDLSLPVPFEVGDIITIDCRPFAPVKRAVILEIGDNWGCCAVQCAWTTDDGGVRIGALKHSTLFNDKSHIKVSPLYRAEVYIGELSESEACLKDISKYVHGNEEKGRTLWKFIYEAKTRSVPSEIIREYIDRS